MPLVLVFDLVGDREHHEFATAIREPAVRPERAEEPAEAGEHLGVVTEGLVDVKRAVL